jgi:hypothetical protein
MPLSILAELVIQVGVELFGGVLWTAGESAVDKLALERERQLAERRQAALAALDVVVLAALYDGVVTESERRALGTQIAKLLEKSVVERDPEAHFEDVVERWTSWRRTNAGQLKTTVAVRAAILDERTKKKVYEAVKRVLTAAHEPNPDEAYRSPDRPSPDEALESFAEALGVRR